MESAQILTVRCSTGSATLRAPVPEIAALKTRFFSIASTLLLVFALFGGPAIATDLGAEAGQTAAAIGDEAALATAEIDWFDGDVDAALGLAKEQGKPVFLYWGAGWCPYCAQLESSVFVHPEFVSLSRRLVAVHIDGDDLNAAELGKRFRVRGYPATLLLSAQGEEISRLPAGSLNVQMYLEALNLALASDVSIKQHVQDVLDHNKTLADADWIRLARYPWYNDQQQALGSRPMAETLQALAGRCPAQLGEPCRTLQLTALSESAREGSFGIPTPAAVSLLRSVLASPEQIREQSEFLSGEVHSVLKVLQSAAPEQVDELRLQWGDALQQLATDQGLASRERLLSQIALLGLRNTGADQPSQALIESTRALVAEASARSTDPLARQAIAGAAGHALLAIGDSAAAEDLLKSALPGSRAAYYLMGTLAHYAAQRGDAEAEALWRRRAFEDGARSELPRVASRTASAYLSFLIAKRPQQQAEILQVTSVVVGNLERNSGGGFWLVAVAALMVVALLAWRISIGGTRLRKFTGLILAVAVAWLPISIALSGNIGLKFVTDLGGVWLGGFAALLMTVLAALLCAVGSRILRRFRAPRTA